tara:strand:+ start:805 stop:1383 length:579 start_codon:yes stop_codon:yes gene_type:complete
MSKETNVFKILNKINVNAWTQKKGQFTYLSWAWAVRELLKVAPNATWKIHEYGDYTSFSGSGEARPYMKTDSGCFVKVTVTVNDIDRTQIHPVLDHRNQPIKEPNAFQINTSIQRCLAKAIALHGLGLYIYAGEDLPEVPELSTKQVKDLLDAAGKIDEKTHGMIAEKIDAREINPGNYEVSMERLQEMKNE